MLIPLDPAQVVIAIKDAITDGPDLHDAFVV